MLRPESQHRLVLLAIGLLVLLAPVVLLVFTVGFLQFTGELVLGEVTPLEFLELYIIDVLLLAGFAYVVYRLTLRLLEEQVPASMETLERLKAEEEAAEDTEDRE